MAVGSTASCATKSAPIFFLIHSSFLAIEFCSSASLLAEFAVEVVEMALASSLALGLLLSLYRLYIGSFINKIEDCLFIYLWIEMESLSPIYFYDVPSERVKKENIFLNNFDLSPITINGILYPTVEHYYQSKKFIAIPTLEKQIREAATPDLCKKIAHKNYSLIKEEDKKAFEMMKDTIMMTALDAKFTQSKELGEKLVSTGNHMLIEDSNADMYW
jgi:ribA/ribD-fused uncharacterized protein